MLSSRALLVVGLSPAESFGVGGSALSVFRIVRDGEGDPFRLVEDDLRGLNALIKLSDLCRCTCVLSESDEPFLLCATCSVSGAIGWFSSTSSAISDRLG